MAQMVLRLHEHEAIALEQATGVSAQVPAAMTCQYSAVRLWPVAMAEGAVGLGHP